MVMPPVSTFGSAITLWVSKPLCCTIAVLNVPSTMMSDSAKPASTLPRAKVLWSATLLMVFSSFRALPTSAPCAPPSPLLCGTPVGQTRGAPSASASSSVIATGSGSRSTTNCAAPSSAAASLVANTSATGWPE